ncbi:endonuclease III domain-containing protein [Desulfospira joergensenii]|uniref:endonuclease III domain-containing protein n=1 Tax=Desulfospira joergensenii TaxID=53329 RepID=UPI0003B4D0A8|nr:endonuclease III [Desulfospira joergensenii]
MNISGFIETLKKEVATFQVPVVDLIAVQTRSPFKVLVATILSARTRDEVTAEASKRLFKEAPDGPGLALLSREKIQELIFPVGFYKSKAGYLEKLPRALEAFNGRVPEEIEDLITLPGVGRKTANLVRAVAFDKDAICVDTHVHRIMNIWGYVKTKAPLETEQALRKKLPKKHWKEVNSILVAFGQAVCRPVSPLCHRCPIEGDCPKKGVTPRKIKA